MTVCTVRVKQHITVFIRKRSWLRCHHITKVPLGGHVIDTGSITLPVPHPWRFVPAGSEWPLFLSSLLTRCSALCWRVFTTDLRCYRIDTWHQFHNGWRLWDALESSEKAIEWILSWYWSKGLYAHDHKEVWLWIILSFLYFLSTDLFTSPLAFCSQ